MRVLGVPPLPCTVCSSRAVRRRAAPPRCRPPHRRCRGGAIRRSWSGGAAAPTAAVPRVQVLESAAVVSGNSKLGNNQQRAAGEARLASRTARGSCPACVPPTLRLSRLSGGGGVGGRVDERRLGGRVRAAASPRRRRLGRRRRRLRLVAAPHRPPEADLGGASPRAAAGMASLDASLDAGVRCGGSGWRCCSEAAARKTHARCSDCLCGPRIHPTRRTPYTTPPHAHTPYLARAPAVAAVAHASPPCEVGGLTRGSWRATLGVEQVHAVRSCLGQPQGARRASLLPPRTSPEPAPNFPQVHGGKFFVSALSQRALAANEQLGLAPLDVDDTPLR